MSGSGKAAIGTVVLLVLLLAGGYALDRWAVAQAEERLESELAGSFPEAETIAVEIPGAFFLPQFLSGSLNTVELTADGVTHQGVEVTDVHVLARGVRVADPRTVDTLTVSATVPAATVRTAVAASGRLPEEVTVDVTNGALVASATVLGVPLEATLQPVASDGEFRLEPETFTLGGLEVDATAVPSDLLGDLGSLEVPLDVLPDAFTLTSADVVGDGVRLEATGSDVALADLT